MDNQQVSDLKNNDTLLLEGIDINIIKSKKLITDNFEK